MATKLLVFKELGKALKLRNRKGWETYGQEMSAHDGRDTLQDAIEEALDLIVYLSKMKLERGLIYLAAPYTYPDPVKNTNQVILVAEELIKKGFTPLIPHLNLLWHIVSPHKESFWYEYDLELLKRCDGLLRIKGKSKGADKEVELARKLNIPVFNSIKEVCDESKILLPTPRPNLKKRRGVEKVRGAKV